MLVDEYIKVRVINSNAKHYRALGYTFKLPEDCITITITDLPKGSHVVVNAKCDICGVITQVKYHDYTKVTNNLSSEYHCKRCKYDVIKQRYLDTYGVPTNLCLDSTKDKIQKTCLKRYGVLHVCKAPEVITKIKSTNLQRYGSENPFGNDVIKDKIKATNVAKYGVTSPAQNKSILKKMQSTCMELYGVPNAMQNPTIHARAVNTLYARGTKIASKQQIYICDLYGGLLNYPLTWYSLDIFLPDCCLDVEYNGGRHKLSVKLGHITEEEFNKRTIIRNRYIVDQNIRQMIITSNNDYLPSDEVLIGMLYKTKAYFEENDVTHWVEFDIDHSLFKNSSDRSGSFYDFGELRLISQNNISDVCEVISHE